jgi:nuclear GTP-binding protein
VVQSRKRLEKKDKKLAIQEGRTVSKNVLQALVHSDDAAEGDDEENEDTNDDGAFEMKSSNLGQNSRRAFLRELRKVVESADVILHVLDARDPMGTKSNAIEEIVLSNPRKKLVYILNKADLVPKEILAGWLLHLRSLQPTIPFKCNTQSQKGNLGVSMGKVGKQEESALHTQQAVGAEELLGLLKNYSRSGDGKTIISVGIVGFPNVGKSSLINSLMRTRSVSVSSMPGHTRVSQEVILDKNIRLIDSPGIVFADGDSTATSLRNCVNVAEMLDVITPVQAILERCPPPYLMQLYNIPKFKQENCIDFLALVARSAGKLKKGGIPNTDAAARLVLNDWNTGKIRYYCTPPARASGGGMGEADTAILSSFSSGMDLDTVEDVKTVNNLGYVKLDEGIRGSLADEELSSTLSGKSAAVAVPHVPDESVPVGRRKSARSATTEPEAASALSAPASGVRSSGVLSRESKVITEGTVDLRKQQKKLLKKMSKSQRRDTNDDETMAVDADEPYNFSADFQY